MDREKPVILVVDDEAHILHVVSLKLRNAGYEVITAADGEEGFERAQADRPDLIITDFQMPFLNGVELCEKLRANPDTAELPAIMLTARGFSMNPDDIQHTNIKAVLSKPFSPREVLAHVQEQLRASTSG